jgi:three-Cys-motif partner protein
MVLHREACMTKDNRDFFKSKNSWSEIKDRLLGWYLTPYFQKVLMSRKPIYYVDCFAGQGKFDDGKPGSPIIALQARDACLSKTNLENTKGKIEICLIELNHAQQLSENIAAFNNNYGYPDVISGRYEEKIEYLLSGKKETNIFLYIDPYGIRALDYGLFEKFNTYGFHSIEILINFNSFGFFRDACRAMGVTYINDKALIDIDDLVEYAPTEINTSQQSKELLSKIAGGDYWKDIVSMYNRGEINGYKAEQIFSTEYKQKLRQRYSYVLDIPVRLKAGHRPKYRMIHVCNHEDGCFLMAQNMQKRKDELFINIQQNRQPSLFDYMDTMTVTAENELMSIGEIAKLVSDYLNGMGREIGLKKFLAGFSNEYGLLCEFSMLYSILEKQKQRGTIDIIRTPAVTPTGKLSTFWEESKERRITIRKKLA